MSTSRTIATLLAGALLAPVALRADDDLVDRVRTLDLDHELDARGQLGGVTVDALGFLYVANFRDAVWRISPEGEVETLSRSQYGSSGNAIDSRGDLLQANFHGHTIDRIRRTGEVSRFVAEGLQGPVGIAVDDEDNLYVCNCQGNYIAKVTPAGEVSRLAEGARFACPNGIAFGADGDLYVTNFNHHDLLRLSPETGEVGVFATVPGGAGNAHLAFSRGFFYVTKILANKIVKVAPTGEVFDLAGAGHAGHEDGPALEASLARPNGIAASPSGDVLYVNTVVGEYQGGRPSAISVRAVELLTLTAYLERALEAEGVDGLAAAYERYRSHPVRGLENTVGEMIAFGYGFLRDVRMAEAIAVFELNAGGNPDSVAAQYQLGEAYRYAGRTHDAIARYRKALELDPGHQQARSRLAQLGAA
ncbi:MAG: tetratricopeptide repeat protein [Thermoanaerobaculia bacterium]|nr:tetratricopeptide repeat protein [Thermoanaerobaculia bacterium]